MWTYNNTGKLHSRYLFVILNIVMLATADVSFSLTSAVNRSQYEDDDETKRTQNLTYLDHKVLVGLDSLELLSNRSRPNERAASPTLLLVSRVSLILLREGPTIRTRLGFLSNVNYSSVIAQLDWLEAMGYVEYVVKDKEYARLTSAGISFARRLEKLGK